MRSYDKTCYVICDIYVFIGLYMLRHGKRMAKQVYCKMQLLKSIYYYKPYLWATIIGLASDMNITMICATVWQYDIFGSYCKSLPRNIVRCNNLFLLALYTVFCTSQKKIRNACLCECDSITALHWHNGCVYKTTNSGHTK